MDRLAVGNGTLLSLVSFQSFTSWVGTHGNADTVLTPTGNAGNYFARQYWGAQRGERTETWHPHSSLDGKTRPEDARFGGSSGEPRRVHGQSDRYRGPRAGAIEAHRVYRRKRHALQDIGSAGFVEDHGLCEAAWRWTMGFAWSGRAPRGVSHGAAGGNHLGAIQIRPNVIPRGYGRFDDRVPLDVYAFNHFPERTVTDFASDGSVEDVSWYANVLGTGRRALLIVGA